MIKIQRTGNLPLILVFDYDLNKVKDISIALYGDNNFPVLLKQWSTEDLLINDNVIMIPLTQTQTAQFPKGVGHLEIKWFDQCGFVMFTTIQSVKIIGDCNMSILNENDFDFNSLTLEDILPYTTNMVVNINTDLTTSTSNTTTFNHAIKAEFDKIYSILDYFGTGDDAVAATVKEYVDSKGGNCSCDLSQYATKAEVTAIQNYTDTKVNEVQQTIGTNYATKSYVDAAVEDAGGGCQCDLTNYATKDYVDEKISEVPTSTESIKEVVEEVVEEQDLATKTYVTDNIAGALLQYDQQTPLTLILNGGDNDPATPEDEDELLNIIFNGGVSDDNLWS